MPRIEHNLSYDTPATTWDEGLPLGNGILGALVWGDGQPLNISLDRTDLWDLRPVPEYESPDYSYATMRQWHAEGRHDELIALYDAPYDLNPAPTKIPAGRLEISHPTALVRAGLDISQALASVEFEDGTQAEVFLHATQPVGVLRLRGASTKAAKFHLRAPKFGGEVQTVAANCLYAGDLAQLGYDAPSETSGPHFQAFEQAGWGGFRFAVHLAWHKIPRKDEIAAVWTVASSFEGENVSEIARGRVEAALETGYEALLASHHDWWREYWDTTSLALPDAELERQWFLETYKFGAAARRGSPPITLQGPWTADNGGIPPWKGDYHHDLNTQLSYWPCYSGNRLEGGLGYLDWLWDTRDGCREWTRRFFDLPGLNVPMTADLNNAQIGGWRQYTHSATTAAWLCHHFYLHWRYAFDREFLESRAYPYLRECAEFIAAITAERGDDGLRTLPLSASPEIHDNLPAAWFPSITNYDLSLIRWLLGATAELADEMGETADAHYWRTVLDEMPDYALGDDGRLLVAHGEPLMESHRHFSHLMAIHPLGLITPEGEAGRATIAASLAELDALGTSQWCGYSFSWLGAMRARVGDGEGAANALRTFLAFTLRNSFHANGDQTGQGFSDFTYRPFTLEGNFAFAAGVQEMLLQSHGDLIRVFPAVPAAWGEASFHRLRAEGAFLVSSHLRNGQVEKVTIEAEAGGRCRVQLRGENALRERDLQPGEIWELDVA